MKSRYNSHYGSYSKNRYYDEIARLKITPTAKQIKFAKSLFAMCKENDVDAKLGYPLMTIGDYATAIGTLLKRLQDAGVDVHGNGKQFSRCIEVGIDDRGKDYVKEFLKEDSNEEA